LDDESKDWSRLDFGYTDMNSDALWIMQNLMNNQNIATKTTSFASSLLIQYIEFTKKLKMMFLIGLKPLKKLKFDLKLTKT
jgi:hypothetical protein